MGKGVAKLYTLQTDTPANGSRVQKAPWRVTRSTQCYIGTPNAYTETGRVTYVFVHATHTEFSKITYGNALAYDHTHATKFTLAPQTLAWRTVNAGPLYPAPIHQGSQGKDGHKRKEAMHADPHSLSSRQDKLFKGLVYFE